MSDADKIASRLRRLVELREARDEAKTRADAAESDYREYEADMFEELSDGPIKGSLRLDLGPPHGVVQFTPRETKFGRIIDQDAALEFFNKRALTEQMTKPSIEKARLNTMVREILEAGGQMPPGVDWYARRGVTISRKGA